MLTKYVLLSYATVRVISSEHAHAVNSFLRPWESHRGLSKLASFQLYASEKAASAIVRIITANDHVSKTRDRAVMFAGSSAILALILARAYRTSHYAHPVPSTERWLAENFGAQLRCRQQLI